MEKAELLRLFSRLSGERAKLIGDYPFFGRLLLRLPLGFAPCGTAYTDMSRIVFDPEFGASLSDRELSFVILHELMHCVLKHCTRGQGKLHLVYNIACDIVVNSVILEAWGEREMRIAGAPAMHLAPDGREGREYAAEEIYAMLMKESEKSLLNKYGASLLDSHGEWEQIASDSLLEDIWDQAIKESARSVGQGSGIPKAMERLIVKAERKPKIHWKQVLHDYLQVRGGDYDFSPPDRRYQGDFLLPSFREAEPDFLDRIWYAVDTSGSVSAREIGEAFAQIRDAMEQIGGMEGILSFFDCRITDPVPFSSAEELEGIKPLGGGGTDFRVIFRCLKEKLSDRLPRVTVIITDGLGPFPKEEDALGVPVIWLMVNSAVTPPFGEVLYVRED